DLRLRMMIEPDDLPYVSATGARIDSGSHRVAFEDVVARGRAALERAREGLRHAPGVRVGVGYANYVEGTVGSFVSTSGQWAAGGGCLRGPDPHVRASSGSGAGPRGDGVLRPAERPARAGPGRPDEWGRDVHELEPRRRRSGGRRHRGGPGARVPRGA